MLALEIDNPEIELAFKTQFSGNKSKFINFIQESLKNTENKKVIKQRQIGILEGKAKCVIHDDFKITDDELFHL